MEITKLRFAAGLVCLLLFLSCAGCASSPAPITGIASLKAADQVVIRLGEIQQAVIDTALSGGMPVADARRVVTWISGDAHASPPVSGALTYARAGVAGWQNTLRTGWPEIRKLLANVPQVSALLPLLDGLIGGVA